MTEIKRTTNFCEDVISRQELYDALYKTFHEEDAPNNITKVDLGLIRDFVKNFPSATLQPNVGHWITTRTFMHDGEYYCDKCSCDSPNNEKWDYCPNCGIKMQEVETEK